MKWLVLLLLPLALTGCESDAESMAKIAKSLKKGCEGDFSVEFTYGSWNRQATFKCSKVKDNWVES